MDTVTAQKHEVKASSSLNGLDRIVAVLDALRESPGATLAAVARATGLSEPTTHRYLAALREHRLVTRDSESNTYTLGIKLFELGHSALRGQDPRAAARPHLEALRDQFGETSVLAVHDEDRLVIIAAVEASHGVAKGAKVGEQDCWHSTSLGKAILAELDPDEARSLLCQGPLERFTSRTLTDPDEVLASLRRVRADGVAVDDEESEIGLRCVGAVVRDAHGAPTYAISVSGPTYRITLDAVPRISEAVRRAAAAISTELGHLGA
nr:IclR family transcriptional regulator [Auraticoccus cholistanensis]